MWAMEARTAPDWTAAVTEGDLRVGIHLGPDGEASLTVTRGDRVLKALPPALKKRPDVQALQAAAKELSATRKRMRAALEETMIRGDHLQPQELTELAAHPVIAPMLRSLVWVMNETHLGWWTGDTLDTPGGPQSIGEHALRLAHPHDLFTSGHWPTFQAQVMDRHVTQPFKQVFREYYPSLRLSGTRGASPATPTSTSSPARPPPS